jgi:dTMP kinase
MAERGELLVFEGQGYCGKSTQVKLLADSLSSEGIEVVSVRHPGGTPEGEKLREELIERKGSDPSFSPEEEFDLMLKSLHLLHNQIIRPALDAGKTVISDRYWPSVKVYQGYEARFNLDTIEAHAGRYSQPGLTIFLSVPPEEIIDRTINAKRRTPHSFNQTDLVTINYRNEAYLHLATRSPNWAIVDGVGSVEEVHERVWQSIADLRGNHGRT